VLFDEKMGDTIHIAVGQGFKESGGLNESGIHIDMIKSMKEAGETYFDEAPIYKDASLLGSDSIEQYRRVSSC
jgi:aminopeptidase